MIGVLNVFSFTRGKKFDEGHRKMLAVLASRAAARSTTRASTRTCARQRGSRARERVARGDVPADHRRLRAGARGDRPLHARPLRARRRVLAPDRARLALPEHDIDRVVQAGLMHDVGKIGVRYDMLNKPGKLTPDEVAVFRQHPEKGKRILEPVPCLHGLIDGCWCHHEWCDGGGYPRGLGGQRSRSSAASSRSPTPTTR